MTQEIRRNMALFPIGIVMKLTDLTARQIRYYEEQGLIKPARNKGNQRIFSLNDIDRLLEIKELIDQGVNIAGIKAIYENKKAPEANLVPEETENKKKKRDLTDEEVHRLLKQELLSGLSKEKASLIQGELSRFFRS
ncbi:MerR family glutamine synthetase transcriptional repressor [Caldalkalibacillus uzonensis]|uniref:MerR family glutamine synthetase transcriptional repressor n=1 Tax=Caldalkalibacillus uzonensis TaxID=353224 RepID=A0ABU0CLT4_9BACI|nr:MerR family transcriptional regulator [Caldalkalibacillus uzonensis]MDQ0337376.1 MerR family glutamine synthetase transcriptional repressor [Caldalkalibacillus uzonensis]